MPTSGTATIVARCAALLALLVGSAAAGPIAIGSWRMVGSTAVGHKSAGLALLGDGRVLVAGDHAPTRGRKWVLIDSAELYDPKTETWQATWPLVEKRQGTWSLVVLKNGKVLLAGEHDTLIGALLTTIQGTSTTSEALQLRMELCERRFNKPTPGRFKKPTPQVIRVA